MHQTLNSFLSTEKKRKENTLFFPWLAYLNRFFISLDMFRMVWNSYSLLHIDIFLSYNFGEQSDHVSSFSAFIFWRIRQEIKKDHLCETQGQDLSLVDSEILTCSLLKTLLDDHLHNRMFR
jgi:hypothetical protein